MSLKKKAWFPNESKWNTASEYASLIQERGVT